MLSLLSTVPLRCLVRVKMATAMAATITTALRAKMVWGERLRRTSAEGLPRKMRAETLLWYMYLGKEGASVDGGKRRCQGQLLKGLRYTNLG